jgi:hypothetical protein
MQISLVQTRIDSGLGDLNFPKSGSLNGLSESIQAREAKSCLCICISRWEVCGISTGMMLVVQLGHVVLARRESCCRAGHADPS